MAQINSIRTVLTFFLDFHRSTDDSIDGSLGDGVDVIFLRWTLERVVSFWTFIWLFLVGRPRL